MKRTVLFYLADGRAQWNFGDVRMTIRAPWVSWSMYLITSTHQNQRKDYKRRVKP
jgi:hypothetical protein